jgi:hypothetical protein
MKRTGVERTIMTDRRRHRGPHPQDHVLFQERVWPRLQAATEHLSWLLTRGYAEPSSLKLVGDRFDLTERQRTAVLRGACSDQQLAARRERLLPLPALEGRTVAIDGFNLLTSVEAGLAGGMLLRCRDGCIRDMASMHGSYRKVEETRPAIELVGALLQRLRVGSAIWLLDQPVSNSGRLKQILLEMAHEGGWDWKAELVPDPDAILSEATECVVTADSGILDRCRAWRHLAGEALAETNGLQTVPLVADAGSSP